MRLFAFFTAEMPPYCGQEIFLTVSRCNSTPQIHGKSAYSGESTERQLSPRTYQNYNQTLRDGKVVSNLEKFFLFCFNGALAESQLRFLLNCHD